MYSVRGRCTQQVSSLATLRVSAIWTRRYCTSNEFAEGLDRRSEKYELLKVYANIHTLPSASVKHPKAAHPIKPFSAKHTPETDPWLFLLGVFPKSVHDLKKEQVSC
jgi:hypothetical protein